MYNYSYNAPSSLFLSPLPAKKGIAIHLIATYITLSGDSSHLLHSLLKYAANKLFNKILIKGKVFKGSYFLRTALFPFAVYMYYQDELSFKSTTCFILYP